jgi:hypothetical protein
MNQVRQTRDAELTFFRERTGSRQNMVESEFVLLGTEIHDSGIPWALLARDRGGELEFAGHSAAVTCQSGMGREVLSDSHREAGIEGLRRGNKAQWLKPEIRVRAQHLKAKGLRLRPSGQ